MRQNLRQFLLAGHARSAWLAGPEITLRFPRLYIYILLLLLLLLLLNCNTPQQEGQ